MNAPRATRRQRRAVHGVLLLDKPLGLSSNEALQKAKWLLRAEKAGHTGTLDPLATACCRCASARRPSSRRSAWTPTSATARRCSWARPRPPATPKARCCKSAPVHVDRAAHRRRLRCASPARSTQVPPMHSALKHEGKALYEYARAGIEVERARAQRHASTRIDVVDWQADDAGARRASAARAPTSARWPKTSARRSAAARTWRRCAAPAAAR